MNVSKISLAVAAATSAMAVAGAAQALTLATATPTQVFVSGASAQDGAFERLARLQCAAGSLDIYRVNGDPNQRLLTCTINSTGVPGFPAGGEATAIFKSSVGGSGNGVGPVALGSPLLAPGSTLSFINPATLSACTSNAVAASGSLIAYTDHSCTNGGYQTKTPDAGVSDVEPGLLGASADQISKLDINSQYAVVFGLPVTLKLRNALQVAQGIAPNTETEAGMPSLTSSQVTSLLTGQLYDWNQLTNGAGTGLATANALGDSTVYICRRPSTSGTQASFEVMFLRGRCIAGAPLALPALGNPQVDEGSGSGNVVSCLNNRDAASKWAVGILSTEFVPGANNYRFVKIDGVAPTLVNTVKGKYPYFTENSMQWRKTLNFNTGSGASSKPYLLLSNMRGEAGNPTVIKDINLAFQQTFGDGGSLALPSTLAGYVPPAEPYTLANVRATPVNSMSKSYASGSVNNCTEPALYSGTQPGL